MADQAAQEQVLLDVKVAEASAAYKFYLNQERKILGTVSVLIFLTVWELCGNTFQLINPMFMSAPSLVMKAAIQLFASGEIWNDLYISGIEFAWGYALSVIFAIAFGIAIGRALVGVLVGETCAATAGIGFMITFAGATFRTDKFFVGVLIFAITGMILTDVIDRYEHRFDKWRPKGGAE